MRIPAVLLALVATGVLAGCGPEELRASYFGGAASVEYYKNVESNAKSFLDFRFDQRGTYYVHFKNADGIFRHFTETITSPREIVFNRGELPTELTVIIAWNGQTARHVFNGFDE